MPDEQALRRAGFQLGRPIRLADGQEWTFPLPPEGVAAEVLDPEYAALLRAVATSESPAERQLAELALAMHLLAGNYALGPEAYRVLFAFAPGSAAGAEAKAAFRALADAAFARLPVRVEAEAAGSAPAGLPAVGGAGAWTRLRSRLWGGRTAGRRLGTLGGEQQV